MKKIINVFSMKNMTFRRKMMLVYVISIFFPMLIVSGVYCVSIQNHVRKNNSEELRYEIESTAKGVEKIIDGAMLLSHEVYYDEVLNENLKMTSGSMLDFINNAKDIGNILRYNYIYDFIESVRIYTYNEKLYRCQALAYISDITDSDVWYKKFTDVGNDFAIFSYIDEQTGKSKIFVVRRLNHASNSRDILAISIDCSAVSRELAHSESRGSFYLFNDEGICIAESEEQKDSVFVGGMLRELRNGGNVSEQKLQMPDGYMICCKNDIPVGIGREFVLFILMTIGCMLISVGVVFAITYNTMNKIDELTMAAENLQEGNFVEVDTANIGYDEVGKLVRGFNMAVSKIDILIHEVYEERIKNEKIEKEKKYAEFIALQRQVNPHFLFNILEILRMKCIKTGNKEIAEAVKTLSNVIRNQMSWKEDIIPFRDELEVIRSYIKLYQYSFNGEVQTEISVDDAVVDCEIPKMSVQIFVENAFRHGMSSISKDRRFVFSARRVDDRLVVAVTDNGKGISDELAAAINSGDTEKIRSAAGIGISNACERLHLYYDDDYHIFVDSIPFEKTEVVINLPFTYFDD